MSIEKIWAREILDSRGNPTVEVDLYTAKGNAQGLPTAPVLGVSPHPHPPRGMGGFPGSQWEWGADPPCPGEPG